MQDVNNRGNCAEVGGGYVEFYFLSGQFYKSKNILKYKVYCKNIEI